MTTRSTTFSGSEMVARRVFALGAAFVFSILLVPPAHGADEQPPPYLVCDLFEGGESSSPAGIVPFGARAVFVADDGVHGSEVWVSDGSAGGTTMARDVNPDGDASPADLVAFNGFVYFTADDGAHGLELWRTDGTEAGTTLVKDIRAVGGANPRQKTVFNGALYFACDDGEHGVELWRTDGTESGTVLVRDVNPSTGSFAQNLHVYAGMLYFSANDGSSGQELWRTDGTEAGTMLVKDIFTGGHASPQFFTEAGGVLFFSAASGDSGQELWRTDGTLNGTVLVKDIRVGGNSYPMFLTAVDDVLYFSADDGVTGRELWVSDGTPGGTRMVADIVDGGYGSFPKSIVALRSVAYFTADDGVNGRELWRSDGSAEGTWLVRDIKTPGSSDPLYIVEANRRLYFQATEFVYGAELWSSNGAEFATELLMDINSGNLYGNPSEFCQAGDLLFFAATDDSTGRELWVYELPEVDTVPPVITLVGGSPMILEQGGTFEDPGATAADNVDGDLTAQIVAVSNVNTAAAGSYTVRYNVTDISGNAAEECVRSVEVLPSQPPVITLLGESPVTVLVGEDYVDAGATATDNVDGDLTDALVQSGMVDVLAPGTYYIAFDVSDSVGNRAATRVRTVHVVDATIPVITLSGLGTMTVEQGTAFSDPGATAMDNVDGNLTSMIVRTSTVDMSTPGTYDVTYSVHDSSGNAAVPVTRIVHVLPSEAPVISLLGLVEMNTEASRAFQDPGAIAMDNVDGDVSDRIVTFSTVDPGALGTYWVSYDVSDAAGNAAETALRTVHVVDTTAPVIQLIGDSVIGVDLNGTFEDPGATVLDSFEGDLTDLISVAGEVNTARVGTYTLSYDATDGSGNEAVTVTRQVIVSEPPPVEWYVDVTHEGVQFGTQEAPFATIGQAVAAAVSGKRNLVHILPGEYVERLALPAYTTLHGEEGTYYTRIIAPDGGGEPVVRIGDGCIVEGVTIGEGSVGCRVEGFDATLRNAVLNGNSSGVVVGAEASLSISNAVFYQNGTGLATEGDGEVAGLRNTILAGNGVGVDVSDNAVKSGGYNCYYQNGQRFDGAAALLPGDFVAEPGFVAPGDLNFHLRLDSACRDAGDPAAAWNDRDGSRNDVGPDGGPYGRRDVLSPRAVLVAAPDSGEAPLDVVFEATGTTDEWGIYEYVWDFDSANGIQADAYGITATRRYGAVGIYEATLRVTDNSGLTSQRTVEVVVGALAPSGTVSRWPLAGPSPLSVQFSAENPGGLAASYLWDFENDGEVDAVGMETSHVYAGLAPGGYVATLRTVANGGSSVTQRLPITITWGLPLAAVEIDPDAGGSAVIVEPGTALNGVDVWVPVGAASERFVLSVGRAPASVPRPNDAYMLLELGPEGLNFGDWITVSIPVSVSGGDASRIAIKRYDTAKSAWDAAEIAPPSVGNGLLTFTTSSLGIFAVTGLGPSSDVNKDGVINAVDVQLTINAALGMNVSHNCDINGDGQVNAIDVQTIINAALG